MVSLAKRLENKPFHLVASYCQGGTRDDVVKYLKSNDVTGHEPNLTVTKQGRHPKVKGNGYVPYYMVFDHRGKLRREHMCGAYHGGDGLAMIEWVDKLMKDAPALYLGEEPFAHAPKLAQQVAKKKSLAAAVKKIETELPAAGRGRKADLQRLLGAVTAYRDRELARVTNLMATNPAAVDPLLKTLGKEFKGTALAEPVDARAAELKKSGDLKASVAAAKSVAKIEKRLAKNNTPKARKAAIKKLDALLAKVGSLPYAATIREIRAQLEN